MAVVFYEHHGDTAPISFWIRRCMPTVGSVQYRVFYEKKGQMPELYCEDEFKENDSYHPPRTVCMENGDRLLAEAIPDHISFCTSGPNS